MRGAGRIETGREEPAPTSEARPPESQIALIIRGLEEKRAEKWD